MVRVPLPLAFRHIQIAHSKFFFFYWRGSSRATTPSLKRSLLRVGSSLLKSIGQKLPQATTNVALRGVKLCFYRNNSQRAFLRIELRMEISLPIRRHSAKTLVSTFHMHGSMLMLRPRSFFQIKARTTSANCRHSIDDRFPWKANLPFAFSTERWK